MVILSITSFLPSLGRHYDGLTNKDLSHKNIRGVTPNGPVSLSVVDRLTKQERDALTTSFLAGGDFRWVAVVDKDYDKNVAVDDDEDHKAARQRHWDVTEYMVHCVLRFAELFGYIIVARDEEGAFLGSVCIIPPFKRPRLFYLHFMRSVIPLGKPVPFKFGKEAGARFDAFGTCMDEHHHIMKDFGPHWYVANLGVADGAQGKGVGRILNQAAVAVAGGEPMYLECLDSNVSFYEKMGYQHKKRYTITPKTPKRVSFPFNGMVYSVPEENSQE